MTSPALQIATQIQPATAPNQPPRPDRVGTAVSVALPDGRRLSMECWPGEGAPLVLLHGLLDCAVGWKHLAELIDRPWYAVDLPGFGDSDCPTRNRISAYEEDVQTALAEIEVHDFTLVGHSLGGAVATGLAERLRDDVTALVLIAPTGFGRLRLAEAIQLPVVRNLVHLGVPLALRNPVTAFGVYLAVVGNGHLPDPELVARLRQNAHHWAPGAECANEAITASGLSPRAFYRRQSDYHGPVTALWGDRDRVVPLAHRDGVTTAFPHAQISVWKKMGHHPSASVRASSHDSSKPPAPAPVWARPAPHWALSPGISVCKRPRLRHSRSERSVARASYQPSPSRTTPDVRSTNQPRRARRWSCGPFARLMRTSMKRSSRSISS